MILIYQQVLAGGNLHINTYRIETLYCSLTKESRFFGDNSLVAKNGI